VARIVPLETPVWVDGVQAGRIYSTAVDSGWEEELQATREEDGIGDPWS
jgi:antitoxin (DNA-binding transcriptional repressor) of toxin-antitoxin stability system